MTPLEKRKIIRKLERVNKALVDSPEDAESLEKQKKYEDYLTYINHYPPLWKYISLFPSAETETPESKKVQEETFEKVLKMAEVKKVIRDKELWEADV
jgi:rRNA-processing protein Efg1